jgi:hypothetical protein
MQNNVLTPKVTFNIVDNSQRIDLPQGMVYTGVFKSNRGPLSRKYVNRDDFRSLCGLETSNSQGIHSMNDTLGYSSNVLGLRITRPYDAISGQGDAYSYIIYDSEDGWIKPTAGTYLASTSDYIFNPTEAFIIAGAAPGTFYDNTSVTMTWVVAKQLYLISVYNSVDKVTKNYYVSFQVTADGSNMTNFAPNVINGTDPYIQIIPNYTFLQSASFTGQFDLSYSSSSFPVTVNLNGTTGVNTDWSYGATGTQLLNFSTVNDNSGNIYVVGGYNHASTAAAGQTNLTETSMPFVQTIKKYSPSTGAWTTLTNNNILFNNVTIGANGIYPVATYSTYNGGTIFYFSSTTCTTYMSQAADYQIVAADLPGLGDTLKITNTSAGPIYIGYDGLAYSGLVGDFTSPLGLFPPSVVLQAGESAVFTTNANGMGLPILSLTSDIQVFQYSFATYSWTNKGIVRLPVGITSITQDVLSAFTTSDGTVILNATKPNSDVVSMIFDPVTCHFMPSINLTAIMPSIVATTNPVGQNRAAQVFRYNGSTYLFNPIDSGLYKINYSYTTSNFGYTMGSGAGAGLTIQYSNTPTATISLVATIPTDGLSTGDNRYTTMSLIGSKVYFMDYNLAATTPDLPGFVSYSYDFNTSIISRYDANNVKYINEVMYETVANNTNGTRLSALWARPALNPASTLGVTMVLGTPVSTVPGAELTTSSTYLISSSLGSSSSLSLGFDLALYQVNDQDLINTLSALLNKTNYPQCDLIIDCGFNSPTVTEYMNYICTSRQDCVHISSIPAPYMYSEAAATQYRQQGLNINNDYTFLASPGYYVRQNNSNGSYDMVPVSGAIAASCASNDAKNGPWQTPVGPSNGLLVSAAKLPPADPTIPLSVIGYKEIAYLDTDLMAANQINVIGRYNSMHPGIYLTTDLMLSSTNSALQSLSIMRMVTYIASQAAMMAVRFLFMPNDIRTMTLAKTVYTKWLSIIANNPGALTAYSVTCDFTNNSSVTMDNGILNIEFSLTPTPLIKEINFTVVVNSLDSTVSVS